MLIYVGNPDNQKGFDLCRKYGVGIMATPRFRPRYSPRLKEFPVAVDNGAFRAFRDGVLWDEWAFMQQLSILIDNGIHPDFVVLPDIVAAGLRSLFRSLRWVERLEGPTPLALAVQDGMEPRDIAGHLDKFGVIFVGGTEDWKWRTAGEWAEFAHKHKKKCHIGRAGTEEKILLAKELGADSVDSSSIVRNNSWHILERVADPAPSMFAGQMDFTKASS